MTLRVGHEHGTASTHIYAGSNDLRAHRLHLARLTQYCAHARSYADMPPAHIVASYPHRTAHQPRPAREICVCTRMDSCTYLPITHATVSHVQICRMHPHAQLRRTSLPFPQATASHVRARSLAIAWSPPSQRIQLFDVVPHARGRARACRKQPRWPSLGRSRFRWDGPGMVPAWHSKM